MQPENDNQADAAENVKGFAECAEDERLSHAVAGFRDWAREAADRPEDFWERQRLAVHARLAQGTTGRGRRMAWVWASAAVIVVLGLVLFTRPQREPIPDFAAGYDQDLLINVERSLRRPVPAALEPASLLAQEVITGAEMKSTPAGRRP